MSPTTKPARAARGARATGSHKSAPRWQRRKEARPAEILEAAMQVFVERGYAATRLEDVAARAGVTKGTMYLYFESKEAVFKEMVRTALAPAIERVEQVAQAHSGSARDLVEKIVRVRWQGLFESSLSGIPKLMMSEAGNFPELARWYHDEILERLNRPMLAALRLGIERGEFRDVDPEIVMKLINAPVLIAALWKHSFMRCVNLKFEPQQYLDAHLDIFIRGLARNPESEARRV